MDKASRRIEVPVRSSGQPWRFIRMGLSVGLTGLILAMGWWKWPELTKALTQVQGRWVLWGVGCYLLNYLFRATRFRTLSGNRISVFPDGMHAACIHGMATYILPFRSGDLALPLILKSISDTDLIHGSRVLIRARLLDIMTLGGWILVAGLLSGTRISTTVRWGWMLAGLAMITGPWFVSLFTRWMPTSDKGRWRYLCILKDMELPGFRLLIESILIWSATAASLYCAAMAVGLPLGWGDVWLLISIQLPIQMIPIQGIAQAGSHEGAWVVALSLLGLSREESLNFALTSHAVLLVYVLTLGVMALVIRPWKQK